MRLLAAILLLSTFVFGQSSPGERIYKGKCAPCHSVDGSAASPLGKRLGLRDLRSAEVQGLSDKDLSDLIAKGRRNMPSFQRQLNSAQLSELVQYVRSLSRSKAVTAETPTQSR
jgi:mono/diheme cytochrome c family protein